MKMDKKWRKLFIVLTLCILIAFVIYLTIENRGNWDYILPLRGRRLAAFCIVGISTTLAAISFQTLTQNQLLTPSIIGLDSLYVLFQTSSLFVFGQDHVFVSNNQINFSMNVLLMVGASFGLYWLFFKKFPDQLHLMLMVGIIAGTLFRNVSTFLQVLMDPNEFANIQNSLFASFNNIDTSLLLIAACFSLIASVFLFKKSNVLDTLHLGRDHATGLGIDVERVMLQVLVLVSILTALSTALVGPITFLGFIVANLTYRIFPTFEHRVRFAGGAMISIIVLVTGQLLVERVFKLGTTLSVVIEGLGGIYFLYILLKERKRI